ncbi:MAG: GntR family transcriptional regulator [Spirochaetales bacterium]
MKQKPTKKVPAVSLAQDVYEKLLEKLVNGELVPGHILNRREVAAELGVSVAPVLEAILQLELEGFVETLPRKGTIVKPVEENDFYDQLVLREALECEAARLYCGATVRENFEQLQTLAIAVDGSEAGDPSRWQNEINFHATLVSLSGCNSLVTTFHRAIRLGTFYNMHRVYVERIRRDGIEPDSHIHLPLVEKLTSDDPDVAERAIRNHLRSGRQQIFERRGR